MSTDKGPKLTHAFDLTVIGPPGFSATASEHSSLSVAHVFRGSLRSADGSINLELRAGSDWMTIHPDYVHIDARVSCHSPETAPNPINCDIRYLGKLHFHGPILDVFKGEKHSTNYGDGYYYTQPLLESRSPELAWVNKAVFLSMGKIAVRDDGDLEVIYRIFKVG